MARLYAYRNDAGLAHHYVNRGFQNFLFEWSSLPEFAAASRHELLQTLQPLLEVDEFLHLVSSPKNLDSSRELRSLLGRWAKRWPSERVDEVPSSLLYSTRHSKLY